MAKGSKAKTDKKGKKPTYPPSAAMRRKKLEEDAEKERLKQERANRKKRNVLPPPPLMDSGTVVGGRLNSGNRANDDDVDELEEDDDGKSALAKGNRGVDGDGDFEMLDARHVDGTVIASAEQKRLNDLIKRFEDGFDKENKIPAAFAKTPGPMKSVLDALSKEREDIGLEMYSIYTKLGVQARDVYGL